MWLNNIRDKEVKRRSNCQVFKILNGYENIDTIRLTIHPCTKCQAILINVIFDCEGELD